MKEIKYAALPRGGDAFRGSLGNQDAALPLLAGGGNQVSLNLTSAEVARYVRVGDDLQITLADGRVVVLEGYFDADSFGANRLFLSANGLITEVQLPESTGGPLQVRYGGTESWGKWSPINELIFIDDRVANLNPVDDGFGLLGPILGAAGLGGLLLSRGGGSAIQRTPPTVDDPDAVIRVGGDDPRLLRITGTADAGSKVSVTIDGIRVPATADANRKWSIEFKDARFPGDGSYVDVQVVVEEPDGTVSTLDGPTYLIDTTPPQITIDDGTVANGDLFNAVAHARGVTVSGTAEPGSTVAIVLDGASRTAVVGNDGRWSFTFDATELPAGEYTRDITVTATDSFGNRTTLADAVQIDTDKPGAPAWVDYTRNHSGLISVTLDTVEHDVEIGHLMAAPGGTLIVDLGIMGSFDLPGIGTYYRFEDSVPDGSHLVVSYSDTVGNTSGALLVTDDPATNAVTFTDQLARALGAFDVELIDLRFAEDTSLTITEHQIRALSGTTDTVAVRGGSDDSVTIHGASLAGTTQVDGQGFNIYTLGDATILIEDDITRVNTGVV